MSNFNYGIDCGNEETAQKLYSWIEKLNLYQDGLDLSEARISIISKSTLVSELKKYAEQEKINLTVEVWSTELEYDEAESTDGLKIHTFQFEKLDKANSKAKKTKYKAYAGNKKSIDEFDKWLAACGSDGLEITGHWVPEEEWGSFGTEFMGGDDKFYKDAKKQWLAKGVVIDKLK